MKYDNSGTEGCWFGALFAVIALAVIIMLLSAGCATTCPPCIPKVETVEVKVPVYSCPSPEELPLLDLPSLPPVPQDGASESEIKAWYAQMVSAVKARQQILLNRIQLLEEFLDRYRSNPE